MRYSQNDEQSVILSCLGMLAAPTPAEVSAGGPRLLDIGAHDGVMFSNSRALVESHGFAGVFVEPSPWPAAKLIDLYGYDPRHSVVLAAIGPKDGVAHMDLCPEGVSTMSPAHAAYWNGHGDFSAPGTPSTVAYRGAFVPCMSWATLLRTVDPRRAGFRVVLIDVEGCNFDCLRSMPDSLRPMVVCVEKDRGDGARKKTADELERRGLHPVYESAENIVAARMNP